MTVLKKIIALVLLLALASLIVACASSTPSTTTTSANAVITTPQNNVTTTGAVTTAPQTPSEPSGEFDETNIAFSFGAISDVHISGKATQTEKFVSALNQLKKLAAVNDANGLDALAIAGDIADTGLLSEVKIFANEIKKSKINAVMLTTGNHDVYGSTRVANLSAYKAAMEDKHFAVDTEDSMPEKGARHCVVGDYHFFFIEPYTYGNDCPFDKNVVNWLDSSLEKVTKENPNAYVFVFTHPMIYDTCYGSDLSGGFWYTTSLTKTLSKYPQVMTFSGHLHFPINDERSIMQNNFTALGCGSVSHLATERGYSNMASETTPKDSSSVSSGLLVQIDVNGNIRITRADFSNKSTFKEAWELSYPKSDKSHLEKYSADRKNSNAAPTLSGEPVLDITFSNLGVISASITVPAGNDDDLVHHYEITITNEATGDSTVYKFLSDFYRHPTPSTMAKTLTFPIAVQGEGTYKAEVVAVDSWDAKSNVLSVTKKVGGDIPLDGTLPDAYADFEFENGTASDKYGKFDIKLAGGVKVESTSLTFAGTTKSKNALVVKKAGEYAQVTFKDYTASTLTNFYNSSTGYTIEALYVNKAPSGSQGIVCGTQGGCWGLAEASGVPYLYTYVGSGNVRIAADTKAPTTSLTHVVATVLYDSATNRTYTSIYVNGVLVNSGSATGKVKIASIKEANSFCLGSDLDPNGTGTDLPMTSFALVDVKIYSRALNYKQAETAYNNAVENFKN